jgi:hypothetical protein
LPISDRRPPSKASGKTSREFAPLEFVGQAVECLSTVARALAHARVAAKKRCRKPTSPRTRDFLSPGRGTGGKNNKRRCRLPALPHT